ncbi:uncharacterized protein LOC105178088 [Sesamum indicum]|uniref:Uncharacterized protein LOC105178088 n=1 Tax=Sesamum indicum TaxID=4182 RepID=A0A6I9UN64_SESIN|nr:uncharacterized protein LOC105178088 [Sesamum indicum]
MEMDGVGIERQSSIENEPRTLDIHQIGFAREAALYVVNTRGIEEALRIFTEGLEPVVSCMQGGQSNSVGHSEEDGNYRNNVVAKIPAGLRDIVSAPF